MPKYCIRTIANGWLQIEAVTKDYIEISIQRENGETPHVIGVSKEQFHFLFSMILKQCDSYASKKKII
jgi:hypothetical protein